MSTRQIYVHGLGQTPDSWEKTIVHLHSAAYSMCPDLAKLCRENGAAYGKLSEAFFSLCDSLGGPVNICGLSLGGILALHYAVEHPEKVNALVLIAAQYKMPKRLLQFQNALFRCMPSSAFPPGFEKADFLKLCRSMTELDFSSSLHRISCPVLVICGEKDIANRKASAELASVLRRAELQEIPGAGHEVNTQAPQKLAEVLHTFYGRVS